LVNEIFFGACTFVLRLCASNCIQFLHFQEVVVRKIAIALILMMLPMLAHAQAGNIYFGYLYGRTDPGVGDNINMNGWNGSLEGKVFPWVGIVADLSGQYGKADTSVHSFLFGPRVSVTVGKIRPFANVLFGVARNKAFSATDTSWATAVGGGVDYHLLPVIGWRVQGDFLRTNAFNDHQSDFRLSTGVVLTF
jgi:hypothetical protein